MRRWLLPVPEFPSSTTGSLLVDEGAVAQQRDRGGGDVVVGVEVELVEGLDAGQPGFVDSSCSASFVADVELDAQRFGEERRVRDPPPGGVVEQLGEGRVRVR